MFMWVGEALKLKDYEKYCGMVEVFCEGTIQDLICCVSFEIQQSKKLMSHYLCNLC